jgi:hypothetical protein
MNGILKRFVEIILKIKILNLSNLFGPLQYLLVSKCNTISPVDKK